MNAIEVLQGKSIEIVEMCLSSADTQLNLSLTIGLDEAEYFSVFYNVSRLFVQDFSFPMKVQGIEIVNNQTMGWERDSMYLVHDFEEDRIKFFCESFDFYKT